MRNYSSSIAWSPSDSLFVAVSPEFPGLSGLGATPADALKELQVAIDLALEVYEESGEKPPAAAVLGEFSGQFRLRIPKSLHQALSQRAQNEGVSLNTLATVFLAEGLGRVTSELKYAKDYRSLLESWNLALDQLLSAMVRFGSHASDKTVYEGGYQDPLLRILYRDPSAELAKH
jgi:predicted HicB family RNase H-like nuclease